MNRIGKLLLLASLSILPLAMAGCPAEEETTGAPATRRTPAPTPSGGTSIGGQIG